MEYRFLGNTGIQVSSLCLGTMTFGSEADENEARKMFNICRDVGVNFFDCANKYTDGRAEIILGSFIKDCRDEIILTTKGVSRTSPEINALGASRKHLMLELEKSLKRIQTDYIDIYFLHYFDPATDLESTLRFLDEAVKQGKILYIGVSNYAAWQIMKALNITHLKNLAPIDCIQPMYSLIKRQAEVEILPMAMDQELGVVSYSPLGSGVLTGKYTTLAAGESARLRDKEYYNQRYAKPEYFSIATKFTSLANELGCSPSALAIQWVLNNPAITSSIIGARNSSQLKKNLEALDLEMDIEVKEKIDSLSPKPSPATDRLEEQIDNHKKLR